MKKTLFISFFFLSVIGLKAQAPFNGKVENSPRVNLYPAVLWGNNLYPSANSNTLINYKGAGITSEIYNYHFLDYFSLSFLQTDNKNFRMLGFRNSFSYFIGDRFKIQYFAGIAITPKSYHSYTIDSTANIDANGSLSGGYKVFVLADSLEIKEKSDYFIHNGAFFKTNNHKINMGIGGFFVYRPDLKIKYYPLDTVKSTNGSLAYTYLYQSAPSVKTRAAMTSIQINITLEFFKNHKLSGSIFPGIFINNIFKERFIYLEGELNYRPFRNTNISFNGMIGKSRFLYAFADGGYMIYNEDVLNMLAGIKLSQRISNSFELMAKAELMSFRLADTYSYYAGIKYYLKEF